MSKFDSVTFDALLSEDFAGLLHLYAGHLTYTSVEGGANDGRLVTNDERRFSSELRTSLLGKPHTDGVRGGRWVRVTVETIPAPDPD
jgi:hypothetical protein